MIRIFTIASLLIASASVALAQDYFQQYGNKPVPVINYSKGQASDQVLSLVGLERGDLILRFPNQSGEVGLPLDTEELKLEIQYPEAVKKAYGQIEKGEYKEAIATLRPMVYPVVKYFEVPPENINVHEIIERCAHVV